MGSVDHGVSGACRCLVLVVLSWFEEEEKEKEEKEDEAYGLVTVLTSSGWWLCGFCGPRFLAATSLSLVLPEEYLCEFCGRRLPLVYFRNQLRLVRQLIHVYRQSKRWDFTHFLREGGTRILRSFSSR